MSGLEVDESDILDTQNLEELYSWVDVVPLTRPKKHIARDFSDGVSVAEIVHYYVPRMIELHNYVNANSSSQKRINWNMLNRKVFVKLNLKLSEKILDNVIEAKPGAIEQVLWDLMKKINDLGLKIPNVALGSRSNSPSRLTGQGKSPAKATKSPAPNKFQFGKKAPTAASSPQPNRASGKSQLPTAKGTEKPQQDASSYSAGLKDELYQYDRNVSTTGNSPGSEATGNGGTSSDPATPGGTTDINANNNQDPSTLPPAHLIYKGHKMVPVMLLEVKNKQIRDLQLVVNSLQKKVTFLDNLIQLKDNRVEDLTKQLHSLRSKFQELTQTTLPDL